MLRPLLLPIRHCFIGCHNNEEWGIALWGSIGVFSSSHSIPVPLILGVSESPMYCSADLMWQLVEVMPSPMAEVEGHMQWLTAFKAQLAVKEVDAKSVDKEPITLRTLMSTEKL